MHSKKTTNSVPEPFLLRTTQSFCPVRGTCHPRRLRDLSVSILPLATFDISKRQQSDRRLAGGPATGFIGPSSWRIFASAVVLSVYSLAKKLSNSHYSCTATCGAITNGTGHSQHDDDSPTSRSPLREHACVANDEPAALPPRPRRRSIDEDAGAAPGGSRGGADARRT